MFFKKEIVFFVKFTTYTMTLAVIRRVLGKFSVF